MNHDFALMGGGLWLWAGLAVLVVAVVVFKSLTRKKTSY